MIKGILSIFLLGLLFYFSDGEALLHALSHLTFTSIFILLLISFVLVFISACKWQLFIKKLSGHSPSLMKLSKLYFIGYFVNGFLPTQVGGDVARSISIGKEVGQKDAAVATVLERYTGLIALLFLGAVTSLLSSEIPFQVRFAVIGIFLSAIAGSFAVMSEKFFSLLKKLKFATPYIGRIEKVRVALKKGLSERETLQKAFTYSFLFHAIAVLNVYYAGEAVGWDQKDVLTIASVLPIILICGALPISPQGLGIQEGAYVFFLNYAGATSEQALALALVLRAKTIVLALIGYVLWVISKREQKL